LETRGTGGSIRTGRSSRLPGEERPGACGASIQQRAHPRIPDRLISDELVRVLVFGCAYHRIADDTVSATTLRRRRDGHGVLDALHDLVQAAYDRLIGLALGDGAIDCCITKASCGGDWPGAVPSIGANTDANAPSPSMRRVSRSARSPPRPITTLLEPRRDVLFVTDATIPGPPYRCKLSGR